MLPWKQKKVRPVKGRTLVNSLNHLLHRTALGDTLLRNVKLAANPTFLFLRLAPSISVCDSEVIFAMQILVPALTIPALFAFRCVGTVFVTVFKYLAMGYCRRYFYTCQEGPRLRHIIYMPQPILISFIYGVVQRFPLACLNLDIPTALVCVVFHPAVVAVF